MQMVKITLQRHIVGQIPQLMVLLRIVEMVRQWKRERGKYEIVK
jgi:hypothetical protein